MSEIDMTDDWMNPSEHHAGWSFIPCDNPAKIEYLIERAYRQTVFGPSGSIVNWRTWSTHETSDGRDAAMSKLSDEHPMWSLRARDRRPYYEDRGMPSPGSGPRPGINP